MEYHYCYDLYKKIDQLITNEKYKEALSVLERGMETLLPEEFDKYYFFLMSIKAYYLGLCKEYEDSYNTFKTLYDKGLPSSSMIFSVLPLEENEKYKKLKEDNELILKKAKEKAELEYKVYLPENYSESKKYPVFFALHQGGDNIDMFNWYWKPDVFVKNNFISVYVQSSQMNKYRGFIWLEDLQMARKDIKTCYNQIKESYSIDQEKIGIGGFSCGAILAIDFAMTDLIPVNGFISLCPYEKIDSVTMQNAKRAAEQGVKGVIMEGEYSIPVSGQEKMKRIFDEAELSYQYRINKDIGSRAPEDLTEKLEQGLKYIFD